VTPNTTPDCEACAEAETNPRTGMFRAECIECSARALAQGPQHFLSQKAKRILPEYHAALQSVFGEKWREGHDAVKSWAERMAK